MRNCNTDKKEYIDVLRAIATIAVIIAHVSSRNWYENIGTPDWKVFTIYDVLCRFSVPIFFMISGCLFLNSEKDRSFLELLKNNVFKMVIFLIFWSVVYKMAYVLIEGKSITTALLEILNGDTQVHLWFVYAIIGLYLLIPLLRPFVQKADRSEFLLIVIVLFFVSGLSSFLEMTGSFSFLTNNINKVASGFSGGYVCYFLLGAYLDKWEIDKRVRYVIYLLGTVGTASLIYLVMRESISTQSPSDKFWANTTPMLYTASISWFILIKNANIAKTGIVAKVFKAISKKSLGIYGVHFLFLSLLWKIGFTTYSFAGIISVPVISLVILMFSYFTAALLRRIPVLGKFVA